ASYHVDVAGCVAGVVLLYCCAQTLQHRRLSDLLWLTGGGHRADGGDRAPVEVSTRLEAVRAQVCHPVVVSDDARQRGPDWIELHRFRHVPFGDLISAI